MRVNGGILVLSMPRSISAIFDHVDHRPWPLPNERWTWQQTWEDLAFLHWPIESTEIRPLIPSQLDIDLYDGKAYIAVVPFRMTGVTKRGFPAPSLLCDFPELNVRTYVSYKGKKGVYFFSLGATNHLAVWCAQALFHLPYYKANISISVSNTTIHYTYLHGNKIFEATYTPLTNAKFAKDSFEIWATERYCLYSNNTKGALFCGDVHHQQWPLEHAEITIQKNTLLNDFNVGQLHPKVLFSKILDVALYSVKKLPIDP